MSAVCSPSFSFPERVLTAEPERALVTRLPRNLVLATQVGHPFPAVVEQQTPTEGPQAFSLSRARRPLTPTLSGVTYVPGPICYPCTRSEPVVDLCSNPQSRIFPWRPPASWRFSPSAVPRRPIARWAKASMPPSTSGTIVRPERRRRDSRGGRTQLAQGAAAASAGDAPLRPRRRRFGMVAPVHSAGVPTTAGKRLRADGA